MDDTDAVAQPADDRAASLYRAVGLGAPLYRRYDVARLAGIEHERSVKWWRAMGFPEVGEDACAFSDADVEILRRLAALTGAGLVDDEAVHRLARILSASFSRITEAQLEVVEQLLAGLPGVDPGTSSAERLVALVTVENESVFDLMEDSLVYVWRRQLLAALGRRLQTDETAIERAVGFADLSGFTKLSQRVSAERLAEVVDEFEKTGFDVVSAHGGRAVKLIGDELMFVTDAVPQAVYIGLDFAEQLHRVGDMPDIHCGIAYGSTIAVGGDVFGPAVNLAARLTSIARPNTIVISHSAVEHLAGRDDLEVVRIPRTYDLRGIGSTRVFAVRRRPSPGT